MNNQIKQWLNSKQPKTIKENEYNPKQKPRVQSTVDEGKGLDFNQKAQHIFGLIKTMK